MKTIKLIILYILICHTAFAWGKEGHEIIARLAYNRLSDNAKKEVQKYLGSITPEQAGTWMDDMRSDHSYDYMKSWHYINISKGQDYTPTTEENIVNKLLQVTRELEHKDKLCPEQIETDLLILFHLIGDIHQPLHVGYGEDKGGNSVQVRYLGKGTSLHKVWDSDIIETQNIALKSIEEFLKLRLSTGEISAGSSSPIQWAKESRMQLSAIYEYSIDVLDKEYAERATVLIKYQLTLASLRLAATLEHLFGSARTESANNSDINPAPVYLDSHGGGKKDGVYGRTFDKLIKTTPEEANKFIGQNVIVCGKVYSTKGLKSVNFINMGAAYPNSPFTVVIFPSDISKFKNKLTDFDGRQICVTGVVEEYKGKAEIKVKEERQIWVQ